MYNFTYTAKVNGSPAERHRFLRGLIRLGNRTITLLEVLVLLSLLLFAVYAIWDNRQIDTENTAAEYEMYKPTAEDTRTYDDFCKVNPDVCGWLTIDDTGIDYPLVQGEDNDEYMNKTPDLQFALSGSLFLDSNNKSDFSDFNTIIYGHHMEGPSMFGALDSYVEESFFDSHQSGLLYYGGQWHELELFAFLEVDAYDQGIYSFPQTDAERQAYLDTIRESALQYTDIGVSTQDHILILSTCMTDKTNGRYVAAVKIGDVTAGPQTVSQTSAGAGGLRQQLRFVPRTVIAGAAAFVLVLILLLWLLRRKSKKRKMAAAEDNPEEGEAVAEELHAEETALKGQKKNKGRTKKKRQKTVLSDFLDLLLRLCIIAVAVFVIFTYVFGLFVNSGVGMEPSVQDRDMILYYRLDNDFSSNEAVVYTAGGETRLGRIVARGGDTVEITDAGLMVNGYLQQDYKNIGETLAVLGGLEYPITLAADEVFILGDNREESTDSRMFGPVKLDDVKGSVMTVLRRRDV